MSSLIPSILSHTSPAGSAAEDVQLDHLPVFLVERVQYLLDDDPQLDRPGLAVDERLIAPDVLLAGVLAGEHRLLGTSLGAPEEVNCGAVDNRVQPAAELADRGAVERGGDRAHERIVGEVIDRMRRDLDREAALDVALVAEDENRQAAATVGELARIPGIADVRDQLLVSKLLEFVVGKRSKAHGGGTAEARVGGADAKLTQGIANPSHENRASTRDFCPRGAAKPGSAVVRVG